MNQNLRFALAVVLVGIIAGATGFGLYSYYNGKTFGGNDVANQTLPAHIELTDLDGRKHKFSEWRGHLLLINFWATWCGPCRKEIPELAQAQTKYGSRGFQIIGPAVDDPTAVRQEVKALGINYPVMVGTPEEMISLMNTLGNQPAGLPFSVLVSADGHIIQRHLGEFDATELNTLIKQNLPG